MSNLKILFLIFFVATFWLSAIGFLSKPALAVEKNKSNILISVPFTPQAPLGEWRDERQQDGCEEAAVLMAMAWIGKEKTVSKKDWCLRILILSDFEHKKYGEYRDISLKDIEVWLFKGYFNYQATEIKKIVSTEDIIKELASGKIILAPTNGKKLKNPNFSNGGPDRHMIVIKGYNYNKKEFIVNDPGTRQGESYVYSEKTILEAIRAYETGYHKPIKDTVQEIIVVSPKK